MKNDTKIASGTAGRWIGNFQTDSLNTIVVPLAPIKINAVLALLLKAEPMIGFNDFELRLFRTRRHRMRYRMQISAMHRIHVVVDHISIRCPPFAIGKDGFIFA